MAVAWCSSDAAQAPDSKNKLKKLNMVPYANKSEGDKQECRRDFRPPLPTWLDFTPVLLEGLCLTLGAIAQSRILRVHPNGMA